MSMQRWVSDVQGNSMPKFESLDEQFFDVKLLVNLRWMGR